MFYLSLVFSSLHTHTHPPGLLLPSVSAVLFSLLVFCRRGIPRLLPKVMARQIIQNEKE
jgi:hypothetical protein